MSTPPEEITPEPPIPAPHEPDEQPDLEPDETETDGGDDELDDDPDEAEAEAAASAERAQELAAERQEEAQSIEAQQREQDAKAKKLGQVAAHTAKRYHDILGDGLDGFVMCPLCAPWFPGIRLPVMPDYETVSAVKVAIGEDPDPPLKQDIHSIVCSDCDGLGKVLTGSRVPGNASAQCIACNGTGWQPTDNARKPGTVTALPVQPYQPVPGEVLPAGDEPAEVEALKALGYIVVPPMTSPEIKAAQGG